jgi:hypothetical protein
MKLETDYIDHSQRQIYTLIKILFKDHINK